MRARDLLGISVAVSLAAVFGIAVTVGILSGWSWLSGSSPDPRCALRLQNYMEHHLLLNGKDHVSCRRAVE